MKTASLDLEQAVRRAVILSRGQAAAMRAQRRRRALQRLRRTC